MLQALQKTIRFQIKIGLVIFVVLFVFACKPEKEANFPCRDCNVVLILIDALRPDHLPCYGYSRDTAPFISSLAQNGIVFENVISQSSWTKPSVASLFTSLYPHNHNAKKWKDVLPLGINTLAGELRSHGYHTFAVQTNTFIQARHNFAQGFDEYVESAYPECTADKVTDLSLKFFNEIETKPEKFFAYLHFMDTHYPYYAPEPYQVKFVERDYTKELDLSKLSLKDLRSGKVNLSEQDKEYIRSLYDAGIRFVDDQVHRIFEKLKQLELVDNTLFIITSDHGEEFWEHGGYEHGHSVYNELLRVPLIIYQHKSNGRSKRIRQLVRVIDIYPTLLGILNLDTDAELMGVDLSEVLFLDEEKDLNLLGFSESILYGAEQKSVQSAHFKFIKKMRTNTIEFYDLEDDKLEKYNLLTKQNDFKKLFNEFRSAKSRPYRRVQKDLDDKTKKILKSLGYIK